MNKNQYEQLSQTGLVSVSDLLNQNPRTLIYGKTSQGHDFHTYLGNDGDIHILKSLRQKQYQHLAVLDHTSGLSGGIASNVEFVPDHIVYVEHSDFDFCALLRERGVSIPFAEFSPGYADFTPQTFGSYYAGTYEPKGCEFYCSANEVLRDLVTSNRSRLMEEAAASVGCALISDPNCQVFVPIENSQLLRQQAKLMLRDLRVSSNLQKPKGVDLVALMGLCLKIPQKEWEIMQPSTVVGGTIIHDVLLGDSAAEVFREIQRSPEIFQKNYAFTVCTDARAPHLDALVGPGYDGKPGLAILYRPIECDSLTIVDRIYGSHEVFLDRLTQLMGYRPNIN